MKTTLTFLPLLCLTALLSAQDAPPEPSTRTTLNTPPDRTATVVPKFSLAQAKVPADVRLYVRMNPFGYVTEARVLRSGSPELNDLCLEAVRQWRYEPAQLNGATVGGSFIQPISLGDGMFVLADYAQRPKVTQRVTPALSEAQEYLGGQLIVEVQLDNIGRITALQVVSSSEEELNAPILAAVTRWRFLPAYEGDKAGPSTLYLPFDYVPRQRTGDLSKAVSVDNSQLQPLSQPAPRLPGALGDVNAEAVVEFIIDQRGLVAQATTISTSHAEVGELARKAVLKWKYTPVVRDGHPVAVKTRQPFRFGDGAVTIATVDQPAKVKSRVAPELPRSLEGASGFATVMIEVDATGRVTAVEVRECSHEEFRAAVVAAVRQWSFVPALRGGAPVVSRVSVPFVFGRK